MSDDSILEQRNNELAPALRKRRETIDIQQKLIELVMAWHESLELSVTTVQTTHVTPLETHNNILPDYYSEGNEQRDTKNQLNLEHWSTEDTQLSCIKLPRYTRGQTSPPAITLKAGVNSEESPLPAEYKLDKAKLVVGCSQMVNRWRTGCA